MERRGPPRYLPHWVVPTVFEDVTPEMPIGRGDVFGPVAGLAQAPTLEAALELTGKSSYGNAASIFTTSGRAAREFRYGAGISMIGFDVAEPNVPHSPRLIPWAKSD